MTTVFDAAGPIGPSRAEATPRRAPRLWLPMSLVGLYWAYVSVSSYLVEMPTFTRFISQTLALLGVALIFLIWWSFNRRIAGRDRLVVLAAAVISPVLAKTLSDKTLGPIPIIYGLPILFTLWALWLFVARKASLRVWRFGLLIAIFLSTGFFTLLRMEGLRGAGAADLRWRWSATPEERYLSARPTPSDSFAATQPAVLTLRAGDWPGFRGPNRDAVVRGVWIATDWSKTPPRQLWRRPIGPAWSSMIIVDGRVFTQEQRGGEEAVVCLNADTGSEIWSHKERGRFWDALSSAGPRATPAFADGRIYAQGATGILQCLDAASGRKIWSRDILTDSGAKLPQWGIAGSPLVSDGIVFVYSAGEDGKGLLAYRADSGDLAWTADAGVHSYSSPHLANIAGRQQVLFISDKGLIAVEPHTGKTAWEYRSPGTPPRSCQPSLISDTQLLVPLGMEAATDLIEVAPAGDAYVATKRWTSRNLRPSFNDFVVHDGHIYGFDGSTFCCVDLKTGNRNWRKGNYGTGQVLLLADQPMLLVLSDQGKVALVAPRPDRFEEVGQFEAITGKTWNHPAIAQRGLYVRNAEEIACYDLAPR
jgi:outer membrane protein assembly factor BamB